MGITLPSIAGASYTLDVQIFMSIEEGDFRKTFFKRRLDLKDKTVNVILAERFVALKADGLFEEKQRYIHEYFVTNEACEEHIIFANGAIVNCRQRLDFDSLGNAVILVGDLLLPAYYNISNDTLTTQIWSDTVQFILSADLQFMFAENGNIWYNRPRN